MAIGDDRQDSALSKRQQSESRLNQLLVEADRVMDRLKVDWEKYFLGIDDRPPEQMMRDIKRIMRDIEKNRSLKTALKFRTQTIRDRFTSLNQYWMRSQRQIEEGTHFRQKRKLSLIEKEQALRDRVTGAPDPRRGDGAAPAGGSGHNHDSQELFKDFIMARAQCGQPIQGITPDKLAAQLRDQADKIRQATGANDVRFRVVVENGKPKVKAVTG